MKTKINPSLAQAIHASIERSMATANKSAATKPYVSKQPATRKLDTFALAASLVRGQELVSNREPNSYIAGEQCIYNVQESVQPYNVQEVAA